MNQDVIEELDDLCDSPVVCNVIGRLEVSSLSKPIFVVEVDHLHIRSQHKIALLMPKEYNGSIQIFMNSLSTMLSSDRPKDFLVEFGDGDSFVKFTLIKDETPSLDGSFCYDTDWKDGKCSYDRMQYNTY